MKIGVDIGGTSTTAAIVSEDGKIVDRITKPTKPEEGYEAFVKNLIDSIDQLIKRAEESGASVDHIGIGVPGIVKDGVVLDAPNVFWKNKPLAKDLKAFGLPVTLINDATAAAVAESQFGAGKDKESLCVYTLGTGVGGGIILGDKILTGTHGVATEFGHMLHGPNFYDCNCGKNGCLETYSSATALSKRHAYEAENGVQTDVTPGSEAKLIVDGAKAGDPASVKAFEIFVDKLAESISNLVDVIDPEIFIIGGGVAQAGDFLFDALREKVDEKLTYPDLVDVCIEPALYSNDAGIIGAAYAGEYI